MAEETTTTIEERIRTDLKEATRARDQVLMDTLRMALTAFRNEEVARSRQELSDQDRINLLQRQVKQREEAQEAYRGAGRTEQADKEAREAAILRTYLPAQMSDDAIRAIITQLIAEQGKDFRKVMPLASKATKGQADGKRVSELVREMTR